MVSGLTRGGDYRGAASTRVAAFFCALVCATLPACAVHWPWKHKPAPAVPVHEVSISSPWVASIRQFWDRNTLKLDLTAVSGEGEAVVTPPPAVGWPIRLEFSVQPGSFTRLEVLAAQRVVYQVPAAGKVTVFKLEPSALKPSTPAITLRWSAAAGSEH